MSTVVHIPILIISFLFIRTCFGLKSVEVEAQARHLHAEEGT